MIIIRFKIVHNAQLHMQPSLVHCDSFDFAFSINQFEFNKKKNRQNAYWHYSHLVNLQSFSHLIPVFYF